MASLRDLVSNVFNKTKQVTNPILAAIDRDKSMVGTQLMRGGLKNNITQALNKPIQISTTNPLQRFSQAGIRTANQINTNPQQFNVFNAASTGRYMSPEPLKQFVGQGLQSASFGAIRNRVAEPTTFAGKAGKFAGGVVGSIPSFSLGTSVLGGTARNIGNLSRVGRTALDLGVGATSMALTQPGNIKERATTFKENLKDPLSIAMSVALPFGANAVVQGEKKQVANKVAQALKKELDMFDVKKIDLTEKPKWNMKVKTVYDQVQEPLFDMKGKLNDLQAGIIGRIKDTYDQTGKIEINDELDMMKLFKDKITGVKHDRFTPENALEELWQHAKTSQQNYASDIPTPKLSVEPTGGEGIKLYRGATPENMLNDKGRGISFATDKSVADRFSKSDFTGFNYKGGKVGEYTLPKSAKILDASTLTADKIKGSLDRENILRYAKENGYDAVNLSKQIDPVLTKAGYLPEKEIRVLNPKILTPSKPLSVEPVGGVTPIRRPLKEVYKERLTKEAQTPQLSTPAETIRQITNPTQPSVATPIQQAELPKVQPVSKIPKLDQPSESIIQEARKQIGVTQEPIPVSTKQSLDNLYTQWVDRYNPLTKASDKAKVVLRGQGAELRPENDPTYLVRRLTGAGGIADARFRTELNPILKEMETSNIPKPDMDVYLANKRMAGFGTAGRDIYGADPVKAGQVVSAIEAKYPAIKQISDKMYAYQDKGLKEIADAGFLSPEAVASIKSQNPDYAPLYRVQDEMDNYLGLPTRKTMQGTSPILKIKGSTRQIESPVESIIGNTFRQRAAIEKNRVAQSVVDLQNITDMGFSKVAKSSPDTITIWNNGSKEYWKVGTEIADTAKGVNEESMNLVLKVLQAPASLLRQGATGRNPEFMIPNIIRDNIDAGISSKYGYVPFVDFVSGLKSMLTNDDVYKKWELSGAKIDLGELSGKKEIGALFNEKVDKKKLFSWLGDTLDFMGKYSEQPTRVGLFKKAYQKTGNELISAMESRDATVDFARMGSKMKVANSIIPFLNVGVQGFDKLIRNAKNNPGKLLLVASTYAVSPQIMSTMYNLVKYPEEYKEVPQYEKDANFVFIQGRNADGTVNYVTIPKGNISPVFANPTQNFLEYAFSNDPQSFKEMALSTLTNTLPVVGKGSSLKEIGIKTIGQNLPQAFKPVTENLLNKSFYKYDAKKEQTKDIVPTYLQNKLPYQQTYEFTPKMYQKIGAVLNASPLKVQNLMEGYLAGYSKIPAQIIQSLDNISQGKEVSTNDKTILRRFVKTTYPSSSKPTPEKQPTPSLIERVTGKVGAAETSTKKEVPQWQIDNAKSTMKSSGTKVQEVGNKILILQDNGDINTYDKEIKLPELPKYTQSEELNKKLKSKYTGQLTSAANTVVSFFEAGVLTEKEATDKLNEIYDMKTKSSGGKKAKKITSKSPKLAKLKLQSLKLSKVKISKIPKLKSYNPKKITIKGLTKVAKITAPKIASVKVTSGNKGTRIKAKR